MKIKDIISETCELLARADVAEILRSGGSPEGEAKELCGELLYCVNAVEDELARNYFPLSASQSFTVAGGKINFSDFARTPVRILSVKDGGNPLGYSLHPQYIAVDAPRADVEYTYAPDKKTAEDDCEFPRLPARLLSYGAAAEYCLIEGEISGAEAWESRYRAEIDAARAAHRPAFVPPRRWV